MTERVGLIGWPVEHSVSPAMHNAAFAALGLDWHYELLPIRPGELENEVTILIEQGYRGFNVTVPHKLGALALAHRKDEGARKIGAANTLLVGQDDVIRAGNTDAPGFWRDLTSHGVAHSTGNALILGTGGSAKAVSFTLLREGWRVLVLSRNDARADDFVRVLDDANAVALSQAAWRTHVQELALIVNCTPVGMWPRMDASPWPDDVPLPSDAVVYDLVYNPPRTALMARADAAGAQAIGGLGMLVWQGALAFELWTGHEPPLDVMRNAAEEALAGVR